MRVFLCVIYICYESVSGVRRREKERERERKREERERERDFTWLPTIENRALFYEVSAKTGENICQAMQGLGSNILYGTQWADTARYLPSAAILQQHYQKQQALADSRVVGGDTPGGAK
eukprot:TRINITY_DN1807_c0_g1_i7.p1 TRINITY_DN1807_c0_g1~~TRINITY_DN1807_c0_g1_i7.p1  ORF type:complete len:119 (-),score=20.29 TRINITY_DN1807_c0_g1_i7:34-390(-)